MNPLLTAHQVPFRDIKQVCLWHLDMDSFKMVCFAKLSVPARALGLPMDVLNSVGVLRLEKPAAKAKAAEEQQQDDKTVEPRAEGAVASAVGVSGKKVRASSTTRSALV